MCPWSCSSALNTENEKLSVSEMAYSKSPLFAFQILAQNFTRKFTELVGGKNE